MELLLSMPDLGGWSLTSIDISTDDGLLRRFAERIPVLAIEERELDWPFDAAGVTTWLAREGDERGDRI